ncbi:hypothetical protein F5887DRAFT_1074770 [Amanita rubescens]|nr:hypothetical protein F5887DRAFT_1074770 [Amanita rubescens]
MSATTPKVKLRLSFPNLTRTKLALSIPLDKCVTFAVNPLKWLRFLGFAIYGREGHLSLSKDGPDLGDYTAPIEARSYFFVSQGGPRLVDVDAADDRTSITSNLAIRQRDFRTKVVGRDGTCVITDEIKEYCTACHILPHAKGSNYISNVVHHRGGPDDDINDINDIRNGLLLAYHLHVPFGAGNIAFLKTPNFGLTVDDIPYNPPNAADDEGPASRLTLHHFGGFPQLGCLTPKLAPHNSDARQPQDTTEWPPAVIVDFFYAAAAMNAWSPKSFIEYVREQSSDVYYPEGHVDAQMGDQTTGQPGSERSRNRMSNVPPEEGRIADLLDGVCALWMQSSRMGKKKTEDVHASSLSRNEGIKKWLESVEDPETN